MRKIKTKIAIVLLAVICLFGGNVTNVCASTLYSDTESNNSASEAQLIMTNAMTNAQKVSGSNTVYRYVSGTLSGEDEDWYKVSLLTSKSNYFTISGGTGYMYIDILNSNQETIQTFTYTSLSNSENVFRVNIATDGTYYIRIYHTLKTINSSYNFTIGNPQYLLGTYSHSFGSATLPAKGQWEQQVNLSTVSSIPNQAVGYKITVSGTSSSVSSKRYFYNEFFDSWVATKTGYYYDLPVTEASSLDQNWGVQYKSSSTTRQTFTPAFTINYVYPDLPANEQ